MMDWLEKRKEGEEGGGREVTVEERLTVSDCDFVGEWRWISWCLNIQTR